MADSSKNIRVLVIADPAEQWVVEKDTTLVFIAEANRRGYEVWCCDVSDLSFEAGRGLNAWARPIRATRQPPTVEQEEAIKLEVATCQVVLIRKDPPFDAAYLHMTQLLDLLPEGVAVINRPAGLRSVNEKLATLAYTDAIPPTLVSARRDEIVRFAAALGSEVVIKPIDLFGGQGIERAEVGDPGFEPLIDRLTENGRTSLIVQPFMNQIAEGDKRVIVIGGEPRGALLRLPQRGQWKANLMQGGSYAAADISEGERALCERLAPFLKRHGLHFVGLDFIGGRLTEINVTSPTTLQEIAKTSALYLEKDLWDYIEQDILMVGRS